MRSVSYVRGVLNLLKVQSYQVCGMYEKWGSDDGGADGLAVWFPKKSSSNGFCPNTVNSTPIRDSCSMPGMLWQPPQPNLRTSASPSLINSGDRSAAPSAPAGAGVPSVSR